MARALLEGTIRDEEEVRVDVQEGKIVVFKNHELEDQTNHVVGQA